MASDEQKYRGADLACQGLFGTNNRDSHAVGKGIGNKFFSGIIQESSIDSYLRSPENLSLTC